MAGQGGSYPGRISAVECGAAVRTPRDTNLVARPGALLIGRHEHPPESDARYRSPDGDPVDRHSRVHAATWPRRCFATAAWTWSSRFQLTRIPEAEVLAAIRAGTEVHLRERFESDASAWGRPMTGKAHCSYPSVKDAFGVAAREASVVHDMSTLVMPEFHEEANVAHHMDRMAEELATNEAVFCVSAATEAALVAAFPSVAGRTRVLYQYATGRSTSLSWTATCFRLAPGPYAVVVGTIEPRKKSRPAPEGPGDAGASPTRPSASW